MRRLTISISFILTLFTASTVLGQDIKLPEWLVGGWTNKYESNSQNLIFLTFSNDSIFITKGLPPVLKPISLNEDYREYKITQVSNDSIYRIEFTKLNKSVIYEFWLHNPDKTYKHPLSFSMFIDGVKMRECITY